MRERPILFSAPMIRAILAGKKTQTRRIVKRAVVITTDDRTGAVDGPCPYGEVGDRLWVRERSGYSTDARGTVVLVYSTDDAARFVLAENNGEEDICGLAGVADRSRCLPVSKWRPSIHMPRWASRITLEIKSVRVERLQEITEEGARAEGVANLDEFRGLWAGINGSESWRENCWVRVVEFARVTQ